MKANIPSYNPSNLSSLRGVFNEVFFKLLKETDGVLPARVVSYDAAKSTVDVEPMINLLTTSGEQIERPQFQNIPIKYSGGGGYILTFPLSENDLGLLFACDRDISSFLDTFEKSAPNTYRVKNFADGYFLPAPLEGYTKNASDVLSIQNSDNSVNITLSQQGVTINASDLTVNSDNATVNASDLTVNSDNATVNATTTTINSTTTTINSTTVGVSGDSTFSDALTVGGIARLGGLTALPIARVGDQVVTDPVTNIGIITTGGTNVSD